MNPSQPIRLSWTDDDRPTIVMGETRIDSISQLMQAAPELDQADQLRTLCEAINHLARGHDYRMIRDAEEFRSRYHQKLEAESTDQPWKEGDVRAGDFGVCDLTEIQDPRLQGEKLIFYVEDDYLGIPYRVTAPSPDQPTGDVAYEPLPMKSPQ